MTPERLAKVAEVSAGHGDWESVSGGFRCHCGAITFDPDGHTAETLAPMLDEFKAEDEMRGRLDVVQRNLAATERGVWPQWVVMGPPDPAIAAAEARGAARVREAVEALLAEGPNTWTPYDSRDTGETFLADSVLDWLGDLRAALDAAEKAAVGGVAGAVAGEDAQSGELDVQDATGLSGALRGSECGCPPDECHSAGGPGCYFGEANA